MELEDERQRSGVESEDERSEYQRCRRKEWILKMKRKEMKNFLLITLSKRMWIWKVKMKEVNIESEDERCE